MRVAVASGKGGTGKTMLATGLARALAEQGRDVVYLDADVEEPNGHLVLRPEGVVEREVTVRVPALATEACSGCGRCQQVCAFGAILALPTSVLVLPQLCHSCGACVIACPERVLVEERRRVGVVRRGRASGVDVRWGVLDVGEPRPEPLLDDLLEGIVEERDRLHVIDAPPGTSCLPLAAVRGADVVVLVPEPTPLGLHDVTAALRMAGAVGVPAVAVVNRSDLGDDAVATFLRGRGVPVVAKIPFDESIARASATGDRPELASPPLAAALGLLAETVQKKLTQGARP